MDPFSEVDDRYRPLRPFSAWPTATVVDLSEWEKTRRSLERIRRRAPVETLAKALELTLRSIAIDYVARAVFLADKDGRRGLGARADDPDFTADAEARLRNEVERFSSGRPSEQAQAELDAILRGYQLVFDAAERDLPVSEAWLFELHRLLCAPQATHTLLTTDGQDVEVPLPKGAYKVRPNHVFGSEGAAFVYAPVSRVRSEMAHLIRELSSPAFARAHPVLQAAYALDSLLNIHPFGDGNGRIARALASRYLYPRSHVPFMVFLDKRYEYATVLDASHNDFNCEGLLRFVCNESVAGMAFFAEAILTVQTPKTAVKRLQNALEEAAKAR